MLSISDVDAVEFTPERSMRFTATLITSPEFELPDYKGIPVKVPPDEVTDQELEQAPSKSSGTARHIFGCGRAAS